MRITEYHRPDLSPGIGLDTTVWLDSKDEVIAQQLGISTGTFEGQKVIEPLTFSGAVRLRDLFAHREPHMYVVTEEGGVSISELDPFEQGEVVCLTAHQKCRYDAIKAIRLQQWHRHNHGNQPASLDHTEPDPVTDGVPLPPREDVKRLCPSLLSHYDDRKVMPGNEGICEIYIGLAD